MSHALPERPRLSETVAVRRQIVGGEVRAVLTSRARGVTIEIDEPRLRALMLADGTRDLDALCLACAREGIYGGEAGLRELLVALNDAGVLDDGLAAPLPAPPVAPPACVDDDRPIEPLPGYTLVCDGTGSCCRFYGSVTFTPLEAMRARIVAESMRLPIAPDDAFTPMAGAQLEAHSTRAVALVDGQCLFLDGERCGLHRQAGAEHKPLACRVYPAMFIDDGEAIRASVGPECACAYRSAGRSDGAPLVPGLATRRGELPREIPLLHLPEPVALTDTRTAPRRALRRWSARLVERSIQADATRVTFALARAVETAGLDLDALDAALESPPPFDPRAALPWLARLGAEAREAVKLHGRFAGPRDLRRRVALWIADALEDVDAEQLAEAPDPDAERFYLRALAHGHRLSVEGRPLARGLTDRGVRLLAARAMRASAGPRDVPTEHPLAALEAAIRHLSLGPYTDSLPLPDVYGERAAFERGGA